MADIEVKVSAKAGPPPKGFEWGATFLCFERGATR